MPIRPSVAHSYKHLILLQLSPRDYYYLFKLRVQMGLYPVAVVLQ
jgi:hypothetical protein